MGIMSLILTVVGIVLMLVHYALSAMFNPALLGHGMSGTLLVVGAIMCVIANVM